MEAIIGPMFAGKTTELLGRLERARIAGAQIELFKSAIDDRYTAGEVSSHSGVRAQAHRIEEHEVQKIWEVAHNADVIGIDEIQFFSSEIVPLLDTLSSNGKRVIYTGLATNFRGEPFNNTIQQIIPRSDRITLLTAICTHAEGRILCGNKATRTQRIVDNKPAYKKDPTVLVGEKDHYEARCRTHHVVRGDKK